MRHFLVDFSKTFSGYAEVVLPRTKCISSEITVTMDVDEPTYYVKNANA